MTALAERVLDGDAAAIKNLIGAAWPRLGVGMAYGQGAPGAADPGDLEQEAARTVLEAARDFPSAEWGEDDDAFAAYAVARVRQRIAAVLRADRRRRARLRPLDGAPEPGREMATRFQSQVESPALGRALARLSPRMRAVIAGIYWREATTAEVAAELGTKPMNVRQLRLRAEKALRRYLREETGPPR